MSNNTNHGDEIQLSELFLIVLERRKLVLILTLSTALITSLFIIFFPLVNQSENESYIDSMEISVSKSLDYYLYDKIVMNRREMNIVFQERTFLTKLAIYFKNQNLIGKHFDSFFSERIILNTHIADDFKSVSSRDLIRNKWFYRVESDDVQLKLEMLYSSQVDYKWQHLFDILLADVNRQIVEKVASDIRDDLNTWSGVALEDIPQDVMARLSFGSQLLSGEVDPLVVSSRATNELNSDKLIRRLRQEYLVMGVIIVAIVFFLSIFLALFLDFLEKLRNDEARMKKIKDALK